MQHPREGAWAGVPSWDHVFTRHYHSAGTAEERVSDFMSAVRDPLVKAIFFSLGGATAIDLLEKIDYGAVVANPKVIAGGEIGHYVENLILPIGAVVSVNATELSLQLDEPAVSD